MTVVTYLDLRYFKQFGQHRDSRKEEDQKALWPADPIMMHDREMQGRAERHTAHVSQNGRRDHPSLRESRSPGYPELSNKRGVHRGRRISVGQKNHTYESHSHRSNRRHSSGHPRYHHHQPLQQYHHQHRHHQQQNQRQQHHHRHHRRTSSQRRYYEERLQVSPPRYPTESLLDYYSN